jgi:hypothetical protein
MWLTTIVVENGYFIENGYASAIDQLPGRFS